MAYKDLPAFIKKLEKEGQLKRITAQVDSRLEITEIADRMVKSGGPALPYPRAASPREAEKMPEAKSRRY